MMAALPLMRTSLWGSFRPRSKTTMLSKKCIDNVERVNSVVAPSTNPVSV